MKTHLCKRATFIGTFFPTRRLLVCLAALSVVMVCRTASADSLKDSGIRIRTPRPPYPYVARAKHLEGVGSFRVTFDESGKAVEVVALQSTGSTTLDSNTIRWAMAYWTSTGGKRLRCVIPVNYRLR